MVAASKPLPPRISQLGCRHIFHPWTDNCLVAYLDMYIFSCIGSGGFFFLLYFYLARAVKKKNQSLLKDLLRNYLKSCLLFSSSMASGFMGISCILRHTIGKFYYYSLALIPATIAGMAILLETQRNKDFFSNTFANLAMESWYNKMKDTGRLTFSLAEQTFSFMVITSFLSYLYKEVKNDNRYFWFFAPPKVTNNEGEGNSCFHNGKCSSNILKTFTKYFTTGFFLKMLKSIFSNIRRPQFILLSLLKPKTYTFAAFLGFYALIYQSSRCFLYRRSNKNHSPTHDAISGFLSGAAYRFEPNISIFNSAVLTLFQILIDIASQRNIIPNLPYREIIFAVSSGYLFHSRLHTPKYCPPLMHYIMSSITYKKCDTIVSNYHKL